MREIADNNPRLSPAPVSTGPEGKALDKLFERSCPLGEFRMADSDGVLLDVSQA